MRLMIIKLVRAIVTFINKVFSGAFWEFFGIISPCPKCGHNEWFDTYTGKRCGHCNHHLKWRD